MNRADLMGVYDDKDRLTAFLLAGGGTMNIPAGQLDRFLIRMRAKFRRGVTRARCMGDSWAAAQGATSWDKSFYGILRSKMAADFRFSNYGYSGKPIHCYHRAAVIDGVDAASVNLINVEKDDVAFSVMGLNDVRGLNWNSQFVGGCGSDPKNFGQMQHAAMAHVAWMCIPESAKVRMHTANNSGPNPAVTFAGPWVHTGFNGFSNFSYTTAAVGTATFTVPKGDLLVVWNGVDKYANGKCRITVDGVVYEGWESNCTYDTWSPSCYFLRLPTNSEHVVTITHASGLNGMVDSVACVDTSTDFGAGYIYSGPGYLMDGAGVGWGLDAVENSASAKGVGEYVGRVLNNGGCDLFAAALDEAMSQLFDWGFNVVNSRARVGFQPLVHIEPLDSTHPNDRGHAHLAVGLANPLELLRA